MKSIIKDVMKGTWWLLSMIALVCIVGFTFVYWLTHAELTQMQIFLKFWWLDLTALILLISLFLIEDA